MFFRNTASQKFILFAFDATTNVPKTGDAANITPYVSKDYGAVTAVTDTSATEMDATNAPGYYLVDATQDETDAEVLLVSAKSATSNIKVIGAPAVIFPLPTLGVLSPTVKSRTLDVSAGGEAGVDWANVGSPTTAVNLSATNIDVDQVVASVSGAVASVTATVAADVVSLSGDSVAADNAEAFFDGTGYAGTNNVIPTVTLVNGLAANTVTSTVIANNAITAAKIADAAIDAATFAADVDAEILSYIVDDATRIDASALNTASVTTIPAILDDTDLIDDATSGLAKIATDAAAILVDTGTTLDGKIDTIDTNVDSILVDTAEIGAAGAGLTNINLPNQTMDIVGNITGNLSGSVGSVTGAVGSVTGAVGSVTGAVGSVTGNVTGSVGSLAAQAQTDVRTATGLATANLDTQLAAIAADSPNRVTKNTALAGFTFLMTDSTNHAPATGLTITATRSLDGAAFGACTNAASEVSAGVYKIDLAAGDLNGNVVMLKFTATGADARYVLIVTQPT